MPRWGDEEEEEERARDFAGWARDEAAGHGCRAVRVGSACRRAEQAERRVEGEEDGDDERDDEEREGAGALVVGRVGRVSVLVVL